MTTITLLARALSRAPRSSSQVMKVTMPNAGRLTSTGMPSTRGAESSSPCTAGFDDSAAVR